MKDVIDFGQKMGKGPLESFADYKLQEDSQIPEEKQTFMGQNANDDRHANAASGRNDIMNLTTHGMMPTCNSATTLDMNFLGEIKIPNCLGAVTPVPYQYPGHSIMPPAQGNPSTHFMSQPPSSSKGKLTSSPAPYNIIVRNPPAQFQFQRQPSSSFYNPSDDSKSLLASSAAAYAKAQFHQQPSSQHKTLSSHWNSSMGTGANSQLHCSWSLPDTLDEFTATYVNSLCARARPIQIPSTAFSTTPPAQRNSHSYTSASDLKSLGKQNESRIKSASKRKMYDLVAKYKSL